MEYSNQNQPPKNWTLVDEFLDPKSGMMLRLTEKRKGPPAFSFELVKMLPAKEGEEETRTGRFIPVEMSADEGPSQAEVAYSLIITAQAKVAELLPQRQAKWEAYLARRNNPVITTKGKRPPKLKARGLRALAREDAVDNYGDEAFTELVDKQQAKPAKRNKEAKRAKDQQIRAALQGKK